MELNIPLECKSRKKVALKSYWPNPNVNLTGHSSLRKNPGGAPQGRPPSPAPPRPRGARGEAGENATTLVAVYCFRHDVKGEWNQLSTTAKFFSPENDRQSLTVSRNAWLSIIYRDPIQRYTRTFVRQATLTWKPNLEFTELKWRRSRFWPFTLHYLGIKLVYKIIDIKDFRRLTFG